MRMQCAIVVPKRGLDGGGIVHECATNLNCTPVLTFACGLWRALASSPNVNRLFDLIARDTALKRTSARHGGEYSGPCPLCRQGTDRFKVWPRLERWRPLSADVNEMAVEGYKVAAWVEEALAL
jgi:hypothetical protein